MGSQTTMPDVDLGKMALYNLTCATNAMSALKDQRKGEWGAQDTASFDCMHYLGNTAIENAAQELGLKPGDTVIDIGSGFGGTGRYLAARHGVSVIGVELQSDIHELATTISARRSRSVADRVRSVNGDFLTLPLCELPPSPSVDRDARLPAPVDHILSFLCILHIAARKQLFDRVAEVLKPGGRIYIEDYFARKPLDEQTTRMLRELLWCLAVPDEGKYKSDLQSAGLEVVRWEDMSETWGEFVHNRAVAYRKGECVEENLATFYDLVDQLFGSGQLGGCRITAVNRRS